MTPKPKKPVAEIIAEAEAYFSQFRQGDTYWPDELIADRREEARREAEELDGDGKA